MNDLSGHGRSWKTLIGIAAFLLCGAPVSAQPEVGIVTFTVDNVTEAFFDTHMPAFFQREIPGTLFGQTQPITGAPGDITWDDVRSLAGQGWEFGAHGYTHAYPLSQASDEVLEMELGVPAAQIYVATGVFPVTFASPNGDYDARVLDRARFYYKAHFRGWGNEGINRFDQTDHWQVYREQVANTKSVAEICAEMERAGRDGYWLVYIWHRVVETPSYDYENSVTQFHGVLDCAARLRDAGVIRLMTARDALEVVPDTPR
jgi:peptidoglycan/xylan/chitin deacetylase (PgdA/CDA1 family)